MIEFSYGLGESGNIGTVLFGLGESGNIGTVLFGLGESGNIGTVLFGLGESGNIGTVDVYDIAAFAAITNKTVTINERKRFNILNLLIKLI